MGMKERTIFKISLAIALIGIILLPFMPGQSEKLKIKDISKKYLDKKIQTYGKVSSIKTYGDFQVIVITHNNSTVQITMDKPVKLIKNQAILVKGSLKKYKQSLQIQADKIQLLSLNAK